MLLIRRGDGRGWSLPGGIMEPGERIVDCLVREVWEETGLEVEPVRSGRHLFRSGAHARHLSQRRPGPFCERTFECRVLGGKLHADGEESLEVVYFAPDSLARGPSCVTMQSASRMPWPTARRLVCPLSDDRRSIFGELTSEANGGIIALVSPRGGTGIRGRLRTCARKGVEVQILSGAPSSAHPCFGRDVFFSCGCRRGVSLRGVSQGVTEPDGVRVAGLCPYHPRAGGNPGSESAVHRSHVDPRFRGGDAKYQSQECTRAS